MSRAGALSASLYISERFESGCVEPSRIELLSRNGSCWHHSRACFQAAAAGDPTAARGDSFDHSLGLRTAAKLAGLSRSVRTAGVAGIYRSPISVPQRIQGDHAEIYRTGRCDARPGEQNWDV